MIKRYNLLLCALSVLSGCILAHPIASVQDSGITESGRKGTLDQTVKGFNTALFWENYSLANGYATETKVEDIRAELKRQKEGGRIVESKIENVTFHDDAYKAEVDVTLKVQDFGTNTVQPKEEKQSWTFSVYDGWKLEGIKREQSDT